MVRQLKEATQKTKRNIEVGYEVVAMGAAVAAAVNVANEKWVQGVPVWQVVAGILVAGICYKVFSLMKEQ